MPHLALQTRERPRRASARRRVELLPVSSVPTENSKAEVLRCFGASSRRAFAVRSWLAVHTKASLGDTATALMSLSCADTAAVTTSSLTAAAAADTCLET